MLIARVTLLVGLLLSGQLLPIHAGRVGLGPRGNGGSATTVMLQGPLGLALDAAANLYIADSGNNVVRRVDHSSSRISTVAGTAPAPGPTPSAGVAPSSIRVQWVRVDPLHPHVLFAGGTGYCHMNPWLSEATPYCPLWLARSLDGGATWQDLSGRLAAMAGSPGGQGDLGPAIIAADGRHIYLPSSDEGVSPDSAGSYFFASADSGAHWQGDWGSGGFGGGLVSIAIGPSWPDRVYAVSDQPEIGTASVVTWLDVTGPIGTWKTGGGGNPVPITMTTTTAFRPWGGLVIDPLRRNTLYANIVDPASRNGKAVAVFASRSEDNGVHWTMVMTPTVSPPLHTFRVGIDPHQPGALVGYTDDPLAPADRRFLSRDAGRTWRATTCPGDLAGHCPPFILDNVFGPGASYALTARGIYRFHGAGPAETRLHSSAHLPVPWRQIIDIAAGRRYGDPVYVLAKGVQSEASRVLYRSTDAGRTWRPLALGVLPPASPQSRAPGALYLPHNRHHVAAVFVATYRRLGLYLLGQPVTEPYMEGDTLTQDFDHLRLEWQDGRVVVGGLGAAVFEPEHRVAGPYPPVPARPTTPTQRYFPQTKQVLQGDFLAFWTAHGGLATFGAPISPVVQEENDDGSGRTYALQWFQKARLERHPEVRNRRFAILLGLLGRESLYVRGWLPPRHSDSPQYW